MDKENFDASTVNDLETARLALRWALERLHKMNGEPGHAGAARHGSAGHHQPGTSA
jgi:hypothetical protein